MSRTTAIDPARAAGKTKELPDEVKNKLGLVPNMTRVSENSQIERYSSRCSNLRHDHTHVPLQMLRSRWARTMFLVAVVVTGLLAMREAKSAPPPEPGDLRGVGKVTFPITCSSNVQSDFARGVALLHSFFYEEARRVFTSVAERDPKCAMAQWGIAMTWWHPIWTPPTPDEMRAGKAAIEKAMSLKPGSDREHGFITALNTYYNTAESSNAAPVGQSCHGPVGPRDRVIAYEKAMRQLRDKYA